jgi:hypothetical protein
LEAILMAEVALTGLEYLDDEGQRVSVAEGEKVDKVPKDVLSDFRERGAIGEPLVTQSDKDAEREELLEQVAKLQQELAEKDAQLKQPATPSPAKPAPAKVQAK